MADDKLVLADDTEQQTVASRQKANPWYLLIVDDDEFVHQVTEMSLMDFELGGRPLEFLHAYSGKESVQLMRERPDVAVILMDVVMETDHAGLDAIDAIRNELGNQFVRIILRTGQPGQAPERQVITDYDINDYKEKTELTATKLFTVVYTAIASYRDLTSLDQNRRGLEKVIEASGHLLELHSLQRFAQGLLEQLASLLYSDKDAFLVRGRGLAAAVSDGGELKVLAGLGRHALDGGSGESVAVSDEMRNLINEALREQHSVFGDTHFLHSFTTPSGVQHVLFLSCDQPLNLADQNLVRMFCHNAALCVENIELNQQMLHSQQELILMLSEAIERRSNEAGNHVRRVAEYTRVLAELHGMEEEEIGVLQMAAPLHDAGKIAIPDAILNKPGRLDPQEFEVMRSHAEIGEEIFEKNQLPVLQAASVICGQHHERWDGKGYPQGLEADEIHLYARIVALADVFDALSNRRCYKDPWPEEDVLEYIRHESGKHFDPSLVDKLLANMGAFREIGARLSDDFDPSVLMSDQPNLRVI